MNSYDKYITRDQLIFEYLEGNLRPEEKRIVEHNISNDPEFKLQFELWQAAFVKEDLPSFNKKAELYRPVPTGFSKRYTISTLVILITIGLIVFFTFDQKDNQTQELSYGNIENPLKDTVTIQHNTDNLSLKKDNLPTSKSKLSLKKFENQPQIETEDVATTTLPELMQNSDESLIESPDLASMQLSNVESLSQTITVAPDSATRKTNKAETKKKLKKRKKYRRPIRWNDIKRAWYNDATVVPME